MAGEGQQAVVIDHKDIVAIARSYPFQEDGKVIPALDAFIEHGDGGIAGHEVADEGFDGRDIGRFPFEAEKRYLGTFLIIAVFVITQVLAVKRQEQKDDDTKEAKGEKEKKRFFHGCYP